ncbi:MAG: Uma2 family endonuclease [Planctomycetes bacterium]|nr:Uma2 family endonuclease [Planctomycetota bacterium]
MVTKTETLLTAEEFMARLGEFWPAELIGGRVVRISEEEWRMANGGKHGTIRSNIDVLICEYLKTNRLGRVFQETGTRTRRDPDQVRFPDVCFFGQDRLEKLGIPEGNFPEAPDLAIEVVSPSDRWNEVMGKVAEYLAAETRVVWVVTPKNRNVTVFHKDGRVEIRTSKDVLNGEPVLPGLEIPVAEIFEGI